MDIYLLVDSVDHHEEMKKLRTSFELTKEGVVPVNKSFKNKHEQELYLADIMQALNGYGRIVYFRCFGDVNNPQDCAIEFVQEGQFKNGFMDGYCRIFDGVGDGMCEVGFFKEHKVQGKYMQFRVDGTLVEYGVKDGDDLVKVVDI